MHVYNKKIKAEINRKNTTQIQYLLILKIIIRHLLLKQTWGVYV